MNFEAPRSRLEPAAPKALRRSGAAEELQIPGFKLPQLLPCCVALLLGLTGCQSLRPVADLTHYYVLSASATAPTETQSNRDLIIGIAPVEIPAYLQSSRIVVRRGVNEIHYSDYREWGEHLDKGIQRALAGDISTLLQGTRTVTSAWQGNDVRAEVHLSIERFELEEGGGVTLDCQWRIASPGATGVLRSNHFRAIKKGPSLTQDPNGAVNTLSEALADLSKEVAGALIAL